MVILQIKYQWSLSDSPKRSCVLTQHNPTHISRWTVGITLVFHSSTRIILHSTLMWVPKIIFHQTHTKGWYFCYWLTHQRFRKCSRNIPILPEAFLTFASKSSVGPPTEPMDLVMLTIVSDIWTTRTRTTTSILITNNIHSPEEVARDLRILCWLIFFHNLSLASQNR